MPSQAEHDKLAAVLKSELDINYTRGKDTIAGTGSTYIEAGTAMVTSGADRIIATGTGGNADNADSFLAQRVFIPAGGTTTTEHPIIVGGPGLVDVVACAALVTAHTAAGLRTAIAAMSPVLKEFTDVENEAVRTS